jgi:3-oxoacyl-[acyl-carrier protein] reductase
MDDFNGKVALVTGAATKRGMGHSVALELAKAGADVAVVDKYEAPSSPFRGDEGWRGLKEVVEEVKSLRRKGFAAIADVSVSQQVDEVVKKVLRKFGKIDILVNCVGTGGKRDTPVIECSDEDWQVPLSVNLNGSFYTSRAVARDMVKRGQGGKIVHISSMLGKIGRPGMSAYAASKHGIIGLVQCLALELAPHKINVNCICPGWVMTNNRDAFLREQAKVLGISVDEVADKRNQLLSAPIPLGRVAKAKDMADLILFLVSSQSDYMTGQAINATGGFLMS